MKIRDLISKIEQSNHLQGEYGICINKYLQDLKHQDPNALVMWNNGECDRDGIFIPCDEEGREMGPPTPVKEGQAFPNDSHDWVRVG